MPGAELGPLRLDVTHREEGADGGPSLRVFARDGGRQLLRFDCFRRTPHWHLDPEGRDEISRIDPTSDPVAWTSATLRSDLEGLVARAGGTEPKLDPDEKRRALDAVELALRNPPADLEHLEVEQLRHRTGEKWQQYGPEVLGAWVADMDFPVAEPIRRVLQRRLDLGDLGYPLTPKPEGLSTLFAERMRERFDWTIDPRRVELLTDVVQGIYVGLETFTEPGEGVILQPPIYPPFWAAVRETGRRTLANPLVPDAEGRYELDLDGLRGAAAESRVLLLCSPHNPIGRAFTRAELESVAEIALSHDLVVISDEIHADLVYAPGRHVPFASLGPDVEARTVTLTSATKAFNIAGLRCAVAHFGSAELRRRYLRLPRHVRGGVNVLGLAATDAAWRWSGPWLEQVLAQLDSNRRFVRDFLRAELPEVRYALPEATYLAWLDCRALGLEPAAFDFFLEHARVGLSDGRTFEPEASGFVRLNFATSPAILTGILEAMAKAVQARGR